MPLLLCRMSVHFLVFAAAVLFGNCYGNACSGAALQYVQAFAKALEVYDFPLPEETEGIEQGGVIRKGHKVLVGGPGFLLRCHILVDVGDGVAGALDIGGGKGNAVGVGGEYAFGVHGEVAHKACFLYFLEGSIAHALVYHGADHFPMGHFFRADVVAGSLYPVIRHGETLGKISARGCQFCVSRRRAYF